MELKEYIKKTLTDIVEGTMQASEEMKGKVAIGYHSNGPYEGSPFVEYESEMKRKYAPVTVVDFKVKVEVVEGTAAEGGVKAGIINVAGGKVQGEISTTIEEGNEVSFSIPIVWKNRR